MPVKTPKGLLLRLVLIAFILSSSMGAARAAVQSTPLSLIQSGTDRAIEILQSQKDKTSPRLRERREEILQIVDQYFDFKEMAKRALGRPWKDQSPPKQQEFVALFKKLIFNSYVDRVENYTNFDEKVAYDEEKIEGEYALVKTRITGHKNADVQVDYRLLLQPEGWKVYDVIVEGISLVNNYRQQFQSILANGSFDNLLARMKEKVDQQAGL